MAWTDYYDMLAAIGKYYGTDSDIYGEILIHGPLAEDFVKIAKQVPGLEVVTNAKGQVVSYSVTKDITADLSQGWEIANGVNSNIQTGTAKNVFPIQKVSGTKVVEEAGKKVVKETPISKYTNGVKGVLNKPVRGTVAPAIAAVAAGVRLGKAIDGSIYKIGDAMGLNPPEELNPEAWKSIVSEVPDNLYGSAYKWGFNTLFGFNEDTKAGQMYLDENALAYMAQWLNAQGVFAQSAPTANPTTDTIDYFNALNKQLPILNVGIGTAMYGERDDSPTAERVYRRGLRAYNNEAPVYCFTKVTELKDTVNLGYSSIQLGACSEKEFTAEGFNPTSGAVTGSAPAIRATINNKHFYYTTGAGSSGLTYYVDSSTTAPPAIADDNSVFSVIDISYAILGSTISQGGKDGVSNIDGATVADVAGITSEAEMLAKLKELFPELWENRVEQEVAQPDGTTKVITYVPISMPTGGAGLNPDSTGNTQNGTEITEGTATDTQLNTIIQYITKLDSLNKGMQGSKTDVTTPPLNPPATGEGGTPVVPPVTGKASALYTIYNPTLEQVNSLGAWLWSSNFIDQLLKLFSSPMDAIIGLHKVYATPATGAAQNIKVGYLDSGVPSKVVTEQYTTIDCGTINCYEYFGNVLDYNPYTNLRLYLPFIGIIELSNSDVMRSSINVVYHVDVLTGACLAEVKITRDGGGGTLYQYAGNACTTLPISSGSYMGVISSVSSVATRALAGFASGGALGAVASGATGILNAQGTNVVHSGGFSGNAGAMGCKKPYLIVERPQTETADNTAKLLGYGSNLFVQLKTCKGLTKVKGVHVDTVPATKEEKRLIEEKLIDGVIINQ